MCELCTEAVHAAASTLHTNLITDLGMSKACTEAVHNVADQPAAFVQHPEHGESMLHYIHPYP